MRLSRKWMYQFAAFMLIILFVGTSSVSACCGQPGEPTCTPKPPTATRVVTTAVPTKVVTTAVPPTNIPPTLTPVPPTNVPPTPVPPTATDEPKRHKTKVPTQVYPTPTVITRVVECMSDCEFKRQVIDLLMRILAKLGG
jgi:hypothetical protein